MGQNAYARAHVQGPIAADPKPKILETSNDSDEAIETATPISRKERRKQKKVERTITLPTPPDTDTEPSTPSKPPNNPAKKRRAPQAIASNPPLTLMSPSQNAAQKVYPLLICSIGNPGPTYMHTLHSAAHTVTTHITSVKSYRPFTKGLSGLVSRPDNTTYSFGLFQGYRKEDTRGPPDEDDWTFWQSTSLMNVSGSGVRKAWQEYSRQIEKEGLEPRLVVVHDELEATLGKVSVKEGTASPRGHNGLKSCQASLGRLKWWRIGIGIGRPESRDSAVVSKFVMRKMNGAEMKAMEKASIGVVEALRAISEGRK